MRSILGLRIQRPLQELTFSGAPPKLIFFDHDLAATKSFQRRGHRGTRGKALGRRHAVRHHVRDRGKYDYLHHCEVDSSNADFVSDDVTDRFCLLGPASAHIGKLRALARAGVTQFNIYLMCGDEEDTLERYRTEVMPAFGKS